MKRGATTGAGRPIESYAAIGNGRTVALVGRDGAIDWCSLGRHDAPPVLARLLDEERGGFLETRPGARVESAARRYLDDTNVLETTLVTASGVLRLTDAVAIDREHIVRRIEVLEGELEIVTTVRPTFDFVRAPEHVETDGRNVVARRGDEALVVHAHAEWRDIGGGELRAVSRLARGERSIVALGREDLRAANDELDVSIDAAAGHWRGWSSELRCPEHARDAVVRSALVLSLLAYEPTGALVAAATTSLPEAIGGGRNWDYRFTWIRDAALVIDAFMRLGRHDEAMRFWTWIEDLESTTDDPLRILYTLDGRTPDAERERHDIAGYRGSRPVRVGNAAVDQLQLDSAGYLVDAAYVCQTELHTPHTKLAPVLRSLADTAASRWREPDRSIWEMRTPPAHHLASKLMSWVALDRAIALAERGWLDGDVAWWRAEHDAVRRAILERGYSARRATFTQTLDGDALDAAALLVPLVGLLPGHDPRVRSTIAAVQRELTEEHLVRRYRVDDGLGGREGAWILCSFWLAEALALSGAREQAREQLDAVIARANDVGLYAEQIDPASGAFLGNFPQAFSHLALVRAVVAVESAR